MRGVLGKIAVTLFARAFCDEDMKFHESSGLVGSENRRAGAGERKVNCRVAFRLADIDLFPRFSYSHGSFEERHFAQTDHLVAGSRYRPAFLQ